MKIRPTLTIELSKKTLSLVEKEGRMLNALTFHLFSSYVACIDKQVGNRFSTGKNNDKTEIKYLQQFKLQQLVLLIYLYSYILNLTEWAAETRIHISNLLSMNC